VQIPRPGSDPSAIAEYVDLLVREHAQDQHRMAWAEQAERGLNLYLGNHYTTPEPADAIRIVLNRTLTVVISQVAIQAGDPPAFTFKPRETGDKPIVYLNTNLPEAAIAFQQIVAAGVPFDPQRPLPHPAVTILKALIEQGEILTMQALMMGLPKPQVVPKEVMIEVTDQTAAQALQTVFDAMWEECGGHMVFSENIVNKNVLGWQPTLYEFDDEQKRHILTNVHAKQVFVDGLNTDITTCNDVEYDQPIPADEARAKWPDLAEQIDAAAATGSIQWIGSRHYDPAAIYEQNFERQMVLVRTAWIRHQPYRMSPAEAIAAGKVEVRVVGTGVMVDALEPTTNLPTQVEQTREAYVVPGTIAEITPDAPEWPMRFGIRKIQVVANAAVYDAEAETVIIPVPFNKNIPIPYSPYGQGEPKRLEGLQMGINRLISSILTHHAYNAHPPEYVPVSVAARLGKALETARTKPSQRIQIPDDLLRQLGDIGKIIMTGEVPTLPADVWRLLDLLLNLIDREGNQAEVIQGNAAPGWSGEAISSLQNAASQVIRAKSMFTEFYLRNIARLMVHSITTRMTAHDIARYLSTYPVQAIQAFADKFKSLYVDIAVEIKSGSGAAKQAETNALMAGRMQARLPISDPTLMERLGLDPDAEFARQAEWMRKQQMLLPQQAVQAASAGTAAGGGIQQGQQQGTAQGAAG
jgi:hypothetical protein